MKEAFDTFFKKLDKSSMEALGKHPSVPYLEGYVTKDLLLLDTLDKNGYAEWKPELQKEPISFDDVEKELGFTIHPQIKEFYSTYFFRDLGANIMTSEGKVRFSLDQVLPSFDLKKIMFDGFNHSGAHYLNDHKYFLIGTYCKVGGIDNYLVHVNNDTCEVTAVHVGDRKSIKLADSIEELLFNMNGKWSR
jgi:hypothetical protein